MGDYSYDQLGTYIGNMIDEAINATMRMLYFHGSTHTGFEGSLGGSEPMKISPLGGKYEGSTFVAGGVATTPTGEPAVFRVVGEGWPFSDLQGMVDYYSTQINNLFDPWWQTPQPSGFDGQIAQAHKLAHLLAYQGKDKAGPGASYFGANDDLRHIQLIQQRVSNLDGKAILTFEDNFSDRMDDVVNAQDAAACLAWVGVAGEKNIWVKSQESLAQIAGEGVEAMKAVWNGGGGGIGAVLNVLGAVALIAAEVATDGLATALTVAGVVGQTASDFTPEKGEDETVPLGSDNPFGVLGNVSGALDKLKAKIRQEEQWISRHMQSMTDLIYGGSRGGFDLSQPALAHQTSKSQLYEAGEIKADFEVMKTVATQYMPIVSQQLSSAAGMAEDTGPGPWNRPGDIGLSNSGPYAAWSGLNTAIKGVAGETATSIDTAADALVIVANDFGKSDATVRTDMGRLGSRLDAQAAAASRTAH